MTILYYDCFAGISGDMNLGAMVDLGVPPDHLEAELGKLKLDGYSLRISKGEKNGISGTKVDVELKEAKHSHHHRRGFNDIKNLIENSELDKKIKEYSIRIFRKLAEAEAKIHNKTIEEIHFHEVGAVDSIVDIVGAAICFHYLKPDKIMASSVEVGGGFVKCEHGIFPVPAPATAELLAGTPIKSGAVNTETTTPT
ncbi:MAG: LarC family nickel insertion protein, partial [Bacteroidales bacterium]|nr:LarC family nickel insertion protein [Bacteroidales bacterium]